MAATVAGLAIESVFDIVKGWIRRKFPDPVEAKKAEQEFQEFAYDNQHKEVQQFYDFMSRYEGDAKDVTPWLQNYRGSVRPTITYALITAYVLGVINHWPDIHMQNLYILNVISMGFWYGERALKNLGLDLTKAVSKKPV